MRLPAEHYRIEYLYREFRQAEVVKTSAYLLSIMVKNSPTVPIYQSFFIYLHDFLIIYIETKNIGLSERIDLKLKLKKKIDI